MEIRMLRARHDRGAGAVEYAMLLALVALIAIGGLAFMGSRASSSLSASQSMIGGATSSTSTTAAPTTTTTRPAGVPKDWPADKPVPPMPDNCRQPKLEDNGRWNCQR